MLNERARTACHERKSRQSAVRAGTLGLPIAFAIIGGMPERFAPLVDLIGYLPGNPIRHVQCPRTVYMFFIFHIIFSFLSATMISSSSVLLMIFIIIWMG
ncbi:hypothetical protein FE784_20445 [Paenibacillus hemerocallicola]|uniref:Uncharacterized protein n=1 Tax=Paenibacillus hemerocallicola TaxID=1172614 RepID=A0A5C4T5K9_9BACL|nr:hypothetical protein FE784_20445 [Paenibacillus hemerocallicola]